MKSLFALTLFLSLIQSGCGVGPKSDPLSTDKGNTSYTDTLIHDRVKRRYHVHLPSGYKTDKPSALLIVLHGGGGRGDSFDRLMTAGTLGEAANAKGVVLVYPEGIRKQWNDGRSEILRGKKGQDDVGFISALIDVLIDQHGIDANRIYATGISNGGHMSFRLAMDLSSKIAAVAPVTAQVSKAIAASRPEKPISVMIINGTDDPLVPYQGGHIRLSRFGRSRGEVLSSLKSAAVFVERNQCSGNPSTETIEDRDPDDGTKSEIMSYDNCLDGSSVKLVTVNGGGHTWPGGNLYLRERRIGLLAKDFNASNLILDFLLSHSLSGN